jgi:hypothetical protein
MWMRLVSAEHANGSRTGRAAPPSRRGRRTIAIVVLARRTESVLWRPAAIRRRHEQSPALPGAVTPDRRAAYARWMVGSGPCPGPVSFSGCDLCEGIPSVWQRRPGGQALPLDLSCRGRHDPGRQRGSVRRARCRCVGPGQPRGGAPDRQVRAAARLAGPSK